MQIARLSAALGNMRRAQHITIEGSIVVAATRAGVAAAPNGWISVWQFRGARTVSSMSPRCCCSLTPQYACLRTSSSPQVRFARTPPRYLIALASSKLHIAAVPDDHPKRDPTKWTFYGLFDGAWVPLLNEEVTPPNERFTSFGITRRVSLPLCPIYWV